MVVVSNVQSISPGIFAPTICSCESGDTSTSIVGLRCDKPAPVDRHVKRREWIIPFGIEWRSCVGFGIQQMVEGLLSTQRIYVSWVEVRSVFLEDILSLTFLPYRRTPSRAPHEVLLHCSAQIQNSIFFLQYSYCGLNRRHGLHLWNFYCRCVVERLAPKPIE